MGKNKKPMLTVLVEENKLQQLRNYASIQGVSMGAIINQLIDRLLSGESSPEPRATSIDPNNSIEIKGDESIGINPNSIEIMIASYIDNHHKSVEEKLANSIEANHKTIETTIADSIDNHNKYLEEIIATSIDNYMKTLPPTLSLQDIDRLIGSTTSSITKANNEVIAELKNIIGHHSTEIDRVSKLVDKLSSTANSAANPKPNQTPNSLSWGGFCEMIGEPLPTDRNKASGDKMTVVASNKGFSGWKYNGNSKKFTLG